MTTPAPPPPPQSPADFPRPLSATDPRPPPAGFVAVGLPSGASPAITVEYPVIPLVRPDEVRGNVQEWCGPTDTSNWAVRGRLMAGAYPGHASDAEKHRSTMASILACGVTTFVCLQPTSELSSFRPYHDTALEVWRQMQEDGSSGVSKKELQFLHFPIPDMYVVEDEKVLALLDELIARFHAGEVIYIHCWGGHGRTGTVVACMLARLHGLSGTEGAKMALELTSALHSCRARRNGNRSPQHPSQFTQVRRLVGGPEAVAAADADADPDTDEGDSMQ